MYYDKKHSKNPADLKWNETDFSAIGEPPDWPRTIFVFTHGFVDRSSSIFFSLNYIGSMQNAFFKINELTFELEKV